MCHRLYFLKHIAFLSPKIDLVSTNSADPDELMHEAALYLGLHCLQKYLFKGKSSIGVYYVKKTLHIVYMNDN